MTLHKANRDAHTCCCTNGFWGRQSLAGAWLVGELTGRAGCKQDVYVQQEKAEME